MSGLYSREPLTDYRRPRCTLPPREPLVLRAERSLWTAAGGVAAVWLLIIAAGSTMELVRLVAWAIAHIG